MQSKRIISVFIILIFCVALAIGGSSMFTIAEIDTTYTLYSEKQIEEIDNIDKLLNKYQGKSLIVVKNYQLEKELENYTYLKITEIKKIFPNSLTLKINERTELFAVKQNESFFMLDNECFVLTNKPFNKNNIDELENIILEIDAMLEVGSALKYNNDLLINAFEYTIDGINEKLNGRIRSIVKNVKVLDKENRITIKMAEGISLRIDNATENITEKINRIMELYLSESLTAEQKADANSFIVATQTNAGVITTYSPGY